MPRTIEQILSRCDELAARFEEYTPQAQDEVSMEALEDLRNAVGEQAAAQRHLVEAIRKARHSRISWEIIGEHVGTTGEAARQRYQALTV